MFHVIKIYIIFRITPSL